MQSDIERFLQVLEAERGFSVNTILAYRNDLTQFFGYLTGVDPTADRASAPTSRPTTETSVAGQTAPIQRWDQLTDFELTNYLLHLKERKYASSTVARKMAAIKSFFGFLIAEGQMRGDPAARMSPPKVDKYTPRAISTSEVERLLQQPGKDEVPGSHRPETMRDRAMLETLYATGMRVSELVALDCEDVDLTSSRMTCAGRTVRERLVPIRSSAVAAIDRYLADARPVLVL